MRLRGQVKILAEQLVVGWEMESEKSGGDELWVGGIVG